MATHMSCTRAILVCILALLATWASCNYSGVQFLDHTFLHVLLPTTPVSCTTLPLTCDVSAPCWYAFHTCFHRLWNIKLQLSEANLGHHVELCGGQYYLVSMHSVLVMCFCWRNLWSLSGVEALWFYCRYTYTLCAKGHHPCPFLFGRLWHMFLLAYKPFFLMHMHLVAVFVAHVGLGLVHCAYT